MKKEEMKPEMEMEDNMEDSVEDSEEMDWKAKCDADTLLQAAEIKKDAKRYKAAIKMLQEKKSAIESIADLKQKISEKEEA